MDTHTPKTFRNAEEAYQWFSKQARGNAALSFEEFASAHPEWAVALEVLHSSSGDGPRMTTTSFEDALGAAVRNDIPSTKDELALLVQARDSFESTAPGRFDVQGVLGRGGTSIVLRAHDNRFGRTVALKVLLAEPSDEPRRKRFIRECELTAKLEHPGVISIHDQGETSDGLLFLVMPEVRGKTLAELLPGASPRDVARILERTCEAVGFAHRLGVIHRDLKPENIMVGEFGEVFVTDWGLARNRNDGNESAAEGNSNEGAGELTLTGAVLGTPCYLAPECLDGTYDARSEVYALGAILYAYLVGIPPYADAASTHREVLSSLSEGPPRAIVDAKSEAPAELVSVSEKAMARDPDARYQSVDELREELSAFTSGRVVKAHEQGAFAELRKWALRNKALSASIVVGTLLAFSGLFAAWIIERRASLEISRLSDDEVLAKILVADEFLAKNPRPARDMRKWLIRTRGFLQSLPDFESRLLHLRNRGKKVTDSEDDARREHPLTRRLSNTRHHISLVDTKIAKYSNSRREALSVSAIRETVVSSLRARRANLLSRLSQLETLVSTDTTSYAFEAPRDQWVHDALAGIVTNLRTVTLEKPIGSLYSRLRSTYQADLRAVTEFREQWREALAQIRSADHSDYRNFVQQIGLVPLGRDPQSGLFEFGHLATGEPAARRSDGTLEIGEETGVVLVLIPSGPFEMGSEQGIDALSRPDEFPSHTVKLRVFMIPKYE